MCCCGTPTINGQPGYRWQPWDTPMVYSPQPPALGENDTLLYDEPGRCGGVDAHSHHFRLVSNGRGLYAYALLVHHGCGDERIELPCNFGPVASALDALDTNARYWLFHGLYSLHGAAAKRARETEHAEWVNAAAAGRIKTRKNTKRGVVRVWIDQPEALPFAV